MAVRSDSTLDVPEPEVALVINAFGEIVGYTVCDDVSSRSIEGENPLYLPQAKIYLGSCALGPMVRPAWEVADPYALRIELTIRRSGAVAWQGSASTAQLHRRYDDLAGYLMRADVYPEGVVLSTGTCLVPPAPFSLEAGDVVEMSIDEIGTLTTDVVRGLDAACASSGRRRPSGQRGRPELLVVACHCRRRLPHFPWAGFSSPGCGEMCKRRGFLTGV